MNENNVYPDIYVFKRFICYKIINNKTPDVQTNNEKLPVKV